MIGAAVLMPGVLSALVRPLVLRWGKWQSESGPAISSPSSRLHLRSRFAFLSISDPQSELTVNRVSAPIAAVDKTGEL